MDLTSSRLFFSDDQRREDYTGPPHTGIPGHRRDCFNITNNHIDNAFNDNFETHDSGFGRVPSTNQRVRPQHQTPNVPQHMIENGVLPHSMQRTNQRMRQTFSNPTRSILEEKTVQNMPRNNDNDDDEFDDINVPNNPPISVRETNISPFNAQGKNLFNKQEKERLPREAEARERQRLEEQLAKEKAEAERKAEAARENERLLKEEEERLRREGETRERQRLKEEEEKVLQLAKEKAEAEHRAKLEQAAREKELLWKEEKEGLRREAEARVRQCLKEGKEKALQFAKEKAEAERKAKLVDVAREKERLWKEEEERLRREAEAREYWRQRLKSFKLPLANEKAEAERRANLEEAAREKERPRKQDKWLPGEAEARERQRLEEALQLAKEKAEAERKAEAAREKEQVRNFKEEEEAARERQRWTRKLQLAKEKAEAEHRAKLIETAQEEERLRKEEERLRRAAEAVSYPSLFDNGRFQIHWQATERVQVPEAFISSGYPLTWPEHLVPITLKNLSDEFQIEYMYLEKDVEKFGLLKEGQISEEPTMFRLNTPYMFTLRKGRMTISTSRTFSKLGDWDLAVYFN